MKKSVRVLYVDYDAPLFFELKKQGVQIEFIGKPVWGHGGYCVFPEVCADVKELTEKAAVDIVIIGNNCGIGVENARHVADAMKDRTVIVWNDYCEGNEVPYVALGFKHFVSRNDEDRVVASILGLSH